MLLDCIGNLTLLAIVQRVVARHDALQLWKFADHGGEQVRLGKLRGALGLHYIHAKRARDLAGQQFDSLHALELTAELAVEHDFRQPRNARLEAGLQILVEEEPRILEPGPDDPLVTADDWAWISDAHIGDDEEFRQQLPAGGE